MGRGTSPLLLRTCALFVVVCVFGSLTSSLAFLGYHPGRPALTSRLHSLAGHGRADKCLIEADADVEASITRRSMLSNMAASGLFLSSWANSERAVADEGKSQQDQQEGLVSAARVADLLHTVPTFTLVDSRGVPYMVVGEDAKLSAYFFTEYSEASRILNLAKDSADKAISEAKKQNPNENQPALSPEEMINPWKQARISTLPMDAAITLVTKTMYVSPKGGGNYFLLAPSEADVLDALDITGDKDLAEGKVPLFYYEDFVITDKKKKEKNDSQKTATISPVYFRRSELEQAYKKANPGEPLPPIAVTELFALLREMVKPGGTQEDLKTIVFVPPEESQRKASDCVRAGGKEPAFVLGERIIVL